MSAAEEKTLHLPPAVVEDVAGPVGVKALARVRVLVEMGAVKEAQGPSVRGKMSRDPIQNHPDAVAMEKVDEVHEVLGRAVPAGGSEIARGLIPPGTVKGVLHDGKELDVGKAQALDVAGQPRGQLPVGEGAVSLLGHPGPGTQVYLVNGEGRVQRRARTRVAIQASSVQG